MVSTLLSFSFCCHLCVPIAIFFSFWMDVTLEICPHQEEEILPKIVLVATCVLHLQDSELVLPLQLKWALLKKGSGASLRVRAYREWRGGDKESGMGWWGLTHEQFFAFFFPTQKKQSQAAQPMLGYGTQPSGPAWLTSPKGSIKLYGIFEPQNHRMVWLIRDLKDHLIPPLYLFHTYL